MPTPILYIEARAICALTSPASAASGPTRSPFRSLPGSQPSLARTHRARPRCSTRYLRLSNTSRCGIPDEIQCPRAEPQRWADASGSVPGDGSPRSRHPGPGLASRLRRAAGASRRALASRTAVGSEAHDRSYGPAERSAGRATFDLSLAPRARVWRRRRSRSSARARAR